MQRLRSKWFLTIVWKPGINQHVDLKPVRRLGIAKVLKNNKNKNFNLRKQGYQIQISRSGGCEPRSHKDKSSFAGGGVLTL